MAQRNDTNRGLIFIPDISGFTRFVKDVEIDHSSHIIRELLETIIDSNDLGLEISEIEGDAVLFYRMGEAPHATEVLRQVRHMYQEFHSHLKRYEWTRICHCGACSTAHELALKFVVHFGELTTNTVRDFTKLFGTTVIVAHRLLKNQIGLDEYLLLTKSCADQLDGWSEQARGLWADALPAAEEYDLGMVDYVYIPLAPLKGEIPEPAIESYAFDPESREMFRSTAELDAPIDLVFDVMSDVSFRHHWQDGLIDSTDLNGAITHEGSTHRCVIYADDARDPFLISHSFQAEKDNITWIDTYAANNVQNIIKLEKIAQGRTRATMVAFANFGFLKMIAAKLFVVPKLKSFNHKSLQNLNVYVKKLISEGKTHGAHIELWPEA